MEPTEAITELLSIIQENILEANKILEFIAEDTQTITKILAAEPQPC